MTLKELTLKERFWAWAMCRAADLADFCLRRLRRAEHHRHFRHLSIEQKRVLYGNLWNLYID